MKTCDYALLVTLAVILLGLPGCSNTNNDNGVVKAEGTPSHAAVMSPNSAPASGTPNATPVQQKPQTIPPTLQ